MVAYADRGRGSERYMVPNLQATRKYRTPQDSHAKCGDFRVTPDQAWHYGEIYDTVTAVFLEFGMVLFLIVGIGLFAWQILPRMRHTRRSFRRWIKAILE